VRSAASRLIHQNAVLGPAGAILAVEAPHAAWVRDLLYAGKEVKPAPEAFRSSSTPTARCRRPPTPRGAIRAAASCARPGWPWAAPAVAGGLVPGGALAATHKHAGLTGEFKRFATLIHDHEKAHVEALRKALGSAAIKRPTFGFGSAVTSTAAFTATAIELEDTGVQAYQGQAPFIRSQAVFEAAISIHPVEARHAAWIRNLAHQNPAPAAFNPAMTKNQALAAGGATGFIK
jgi:hypothetical protein